MAEIKIKSAFVEKQVGSPVFVLKIVEPHSKKNDDGSYQTISRTFFDVKVSRESGIDLSQFHEQARISVEGRQKTEVREHEGKKFYSLVIWADQISLLPRGGSQGEPVSGTQNAGWHNPGQEGHAPF